MENLMIANIPLPVYKSHSLGKTKKEEFAKLWANSMSGEEFVKQAHRHIEELYATVPDKA
jgi:hypothetical protein